MNKEELREKIQEILDSVEEPTYYPQRNLKYSEHVTDYITANYVPREEYEKRGGNREFWREIIEKNGKVDIEQVYKELEDFSFILEQLPKVYCAITGGRLSKPMYRAEIVIGEYENCLNRDIEEAIEDEKEIWEDEKKQLQQENASLREQLDRVDIEKIGKCIYDICKFETTGNFYKDCEKWETEPNIGILELAQAIVNFIKGEK